MPTIFSRIIDGEIPGRFVWQDEHCVAFLSAAPMTPGHTLVVSRQEVDEWTEASPELIAHLSVVAQSIAQAQQAEWDCPRVGLLAQGFEVPHLHVHVWATFTPADYSFRNADHDPDPVMMDDAAARLRAQLRAAGHEAHIPAD
ncbi:MAG: HIT family protein [Dermatophilaceae bacterium]